MKVELNIFTVDTMASLGKQIDVAPPKVPVFTPKPQRGPASKPATITRPNIPGTYNPPSGPRQANLPPDMASGTPRSARNPNTPDIKGDGVNLRLDRVVTLLLRQTNYMGEMARYLKVISENRRRKFFPMGDNVM